MAHRYFLSHLEGDTATVTGENAVHLVRVMRLQIGDSVTLCDKNGWDYQAVAQTITPEEVAFQVLSQEKNPAEPKRKLVLYMALPKGDKLELIAQKACELGATTLVPFVSAYCIAQKSKKDETKRQRLQKIADEACKQCGRSIPMEVAPTLTFAELNAHLTGQDTNILFYEHATKPLAAQSFGTGSVGLIIGSEGGFNEKECAQLSGWGVSVVSLGQRILRCETAAITAVSLAMYLMGELE